MPKHGNKRKFYQAKPGQQKKMRREELSPGMTGFLITCSQHNEVRSVNEAYDLLNEYMDVEMAKLDGLPETSAPSQGSTKTTQAKSEDGQEEEEPEMDMDKAMAEELKQYRTSAGIEERKARFKAVESGCNNLVFISSAVMDPSEFAYNILTDIHNQKKGRARYMQRLLPVVATCRADIETVKTAAKKALHKYFGGPQNKTYLILYKTRNSALTLTRDDIIEAIGSIVKEINPECRANLNDPDYAISVDVIKTVCCISVVKDYCKLKKYNVHVEEEQSGEHSRVSAAPPSAAPSSDEPAEPKQVTNGEAKVEAVETG